jgi:hypothetical protein
MHYIALVIDRRVVIIAKYQTCSVGYGLFAPLLLMFERDRIAGLSFIFAFLHFWTFSGIAYHLAIHNPLANTTRSGLKLYSSVICFTHLATLTAVTHVEGGKERYICL